LPVLHTFNFCSLHLYFAESFSKHFAPHAIFRTLDSRPPLPTHGIACPPPHPSSPPRITFLYADFPNDPTFVPAWVVRSFVPTPRLKFGRVFRIAGVSSKNYDSYWFRPLERCFSTPEFNSRPSFHLFASSLPSHLQNFCLPAAAS